MLIIWGFRNRSTARGTGTFACPQCGADRQFTRKQWRRWFTFFFLPVFPVKTIAEEVIECDTCHASFKPAVLTAPTTATLQNDLAVAARQAAARLSRAVGTPAATTAAMAMVRDFDDRTSADDEVLATELAVVQDVGLSDRLARLAIVLNEQGKEHFLLACAQIAGTGGVLAADDRQLLEQLAADLTMTPAHTRGVIDEALERSRG